MPNGHAWLRNGNFSGDPNSAPRCTATAKTTGKQCRGPAVRGRSTCRMHGGTSRGPITAQGLEKSRRARWVHGYYSSEARLARLRDRGDFEEQMQLTGALNQFLAQNH